MEAAGIIIIILLVILLFCILRHKANEKPHINNPNNQHKSVHLNPSSINPSSQSPNSQNTHMSSNKNHENAYRGSAPTNTYNIEHFLKHIKPIQALLFIVVLVIGVPMLTSAMNKSMERITEPARRINKRLDTINNMNNMNSINKLHEVKPIANTYNNEDPIITFNRNKPKPKTMDNPINPSIFSEEQAIGLLDKGQGSYVSSNNNKKIYIEKTSSTDSKHPDNTYTLSIINSNPSTGMARPATTIHVTSAHMGETAGIIIKGLAKNPSMTQSTPIQMLIIFNKNNKDIEVNNTRNPQVQQNGSVQNEPNGLQRASSQLRGTHLKSQI